MLDIKFIRENTDKVRQAIIDKSVDLDLDRLLDLDAQRRTILAEVESFQATKNAFSKELPTLSEQDKKTKILEMQELDVRQTELKDQLRKLDAELNYLMLLVPNIPSPESPVGKDDSENVPWSYWSFEQGRVDPKDTEKVALVPKKFDFEVKDHIALGTSLNLVDFDRGVEVSGFRGYYLKNEAVLIQNALFHHAITKLCAKGFELMQTPTLVREFALVGSGHFPTGKAEVYQVANAAKMEDESKEQTFLAGTSEPSLIAYYANQILDESQLPIKLVGISPCYRSEVGSYGKDAKGLYRVHEFMKVEQVVICKADIYESDKWLETLREISEELLQDLKLPYRVLNICTGDMGPGKYKMYDIETWMPGRNNYGETHSDSSLTDWQARRLNIRYRAADGQIKFAYTLNNTAFASPRILIAIMENYQKADGSIEVPEILQSYVGTKVILPKGSKPINFEKKSKPVVQSEQSAQVTLQEEPTVATSAPEIKTQSEPKKEHNQ
jgi:seryl-tRNA synthetase